jgi:hypothetical protein
MLTSPTHLRSQMPCDHCGVGSTCFLLTDARLQTEAADLDAISCDHRMWFAWRYYVMAHPNQVGDRSTKISKRRCYCQPLWPPPGRRSDSPTPPDRPAQWDYRRQKMRSAISHLPSPSPGWPLCQRPPHLTSSRWRYALVHQDRGGQVFQCGTHRFKDRARPVRLPSNSLGAT